MEENQKMDALMVVLEGQVEVTDRNGETTQIYPNQIIGLEHIKVAKLQPNNPLVLNHINFSSKVVTSKFPIERTDILSIQFDEIMTVCERIMEKEISAQLNTISKIKWFALLEPARAKAFKNSLKRIKMPKG